MKRLFTLVLAALPMLAMAQTTKNVTVDAVGQLAKQIPNDEKFKISELKVSGPLNAADIKLLQQIVNRSKANEKKGECVVTSVDISEAVFTEGKEAVATNKLPNGLLLRRLLFPARYPHPRQRDHHREPGLPGL